MDRLALRLEEAAAGMGIHPDTLTRWLEAGDFPGRKVGRTWLVSPSAVAHFLGDYDDQRARPQRGDAVLSEAGQSLGRQGVDAGRVTPERIEPRQGRGKAAPGRAAEAPGPRRKARRSPDDGWSVPPKVA